MSYEENKLPEGLIEAADIESNDNLIVQKSGESYVRRFLFSVIAAKFATAAQGAKADTATQPDDIADFETTTQLDDRDTNNRNTDNHINGLNNKVFTAIEKTKLASVETGATADQTAGEIKTAYESNDDTNAFTDAEKAKIAGLATVASTGAYSDLTGTPDLSVYDNFDSYALQADFPATGTSDVLYLETSTGILFRWNGTSYTEISAALALGETASTAYRGDRGKTAYDHSQINTGNPHNTSKADVGLSNVDNTSDANKPVSTATQTALNGKKNNGANETANVDAASTTAAGKVELATTAETNTGTDATRAVTPDGLADSKFGNSALVSSINFVIDGGGSAITTGVKGYIEVPFACTINQVTLLADQSGSIVVDLWKDSYASYPPTVADTITASAKPTISSATKSQDSTLTGWTTSISAGDILGFNVDSITTCQRVTLSLKVTRT